MADNRNTDPGWTKLGNDPAKVGRVAARGYLVVAGKKEAGHRHVVAIVPGEGPHETAMGYWGQLDGVGFKTKELSCAWKRVDLANVQYLARNGSEPEGVLGSLAVAGTDLASGTGPAMTQIIPRSSSAEVGSCHLDLGDPDDPKAPRAWQEPIRIASDGKTGCTVGEDVAIVEKPPGLAQGHLLHATTSSGSQTQVCVVDARNYAVRWTSPSFEGAPTLTR